jgi:hypothetical protein
LKKTVELSVLCELKIFMFMYDEANQKVTHFASHKDCNLSDLFTTPSHREFFSNNDYHHFGGNIDDMDSEFVDVPPVSPAFHDEAISENTQDLKVTSRIGTL